MKQLTFDFMDDECLQERIHFDSRNEEELISFMAETIVEIIKKERKKTNDNSSE